MLRLDFCVVNSKMDIYIVVKGKKDVLAPDFNKNGKAQKAIAFEEHAPFTSLFSKFFMKILILLHEYIVY